MTPLKHTYDDRMKVSAAQAIWHADICMEALVVDIFRRVKPLQFIETGTHMGWTSHWVANRYPEVHVRTVELIDEYYRLSGENLEGLPFVERHLGDSRYFLRKILGSEMEASVGSLLAPVRLFWLDAHFHADHPLREECAIVSKVGRCLILIDDYHCGEDFPGDTAAVPWVEETLGCDYWRPAYSYRTGCSGYALFVRGLDYVPPQSIMRRNMGP